MNIVGVLGSPHGPGGNTGRLLTALLKGAEAAGAQTALLTLSKMDVRPCCGCDTCHRAGQCAISDDYEKVKAALLAADGIVLASPNYIFSVSAQTKALLDRTCGLVHMIAFEGKYGAAVVSSGGPGSGAVTDYLTNYLQIMGARTVGSVGVAAYEMANEDSAAKRLSEATTLGERLVRAIERKEEYPDQAEISHQFYTMMREILMNNRNRWPFEYAYWKARGRI
jgi:multimeric flavodoxin WrbA